MKKYSLFVLICLVLASCKDPYEMPLRPTDLSLLVVEGNLNRGGITTISLSRSDKLNGAFQNHPVMNAVVQVEDRNNNQQAFTGINNGKYTAALNLDPSREYRLKITTPDGKKYESEYVPVLETPAIDSVNWKRTEDGLDIFVNTHDPDNNSRYYRWEWEETWQHNASFFAEYLWQDPVIVPIPPNFNIYSCWSGAASTNIILGSSSQLQSDVIYQAPITHVPNGSEKISVRYSILVKQYTLNQTAYEYLNLMKKNTENLGSIFDPQPSELRGNITCTTNPEESVIGFITASNVTEKRLFVLRQEVNWSYMLQCYDFDIINNQDTIRKYINLNFLPWTADIGAFGPVKYYMAPDYCVDCRISGGTNIKPSFW